MEQNNKESTKQMDIYQLVTDQVIKIMEGGVIPWQKPWKECGIPMNLLSKRPYRGINLWLLLSLGYEQNLFLTFEQIKSLGGSVKKGEHGHIVVFWKVLKKEDMDGRDTKEKNIPMLRYYKVFNISQCTNIPEHIIPVFEDEPEFDPHSDCENIILAMPQRPEITHKDHRAYYSPATDIVNMPKKKSFKIAEGYYSTLFHELVHSTGHEKRLGRKSLGEMVEFGKESYAGEELIAEMGAAYLCRFSGILPVEIHNAVAYIDNWLSVFKNDKKFLITASGMAQKAVDYILDRKDGGPKELLEVVDETVVG